jgi:3-hydroxymyristoyl/3-hydroxydecanoyl-(acyl carrier protein) dehydratase
MSIDLVRIAERLRMHPWVMDARCGHAGADAPGVVLVLSHEGIEALCQRGRRALIDHLLHDTGNAGHAITCRLLDTLPASASTQHMDALLQAPLPRDALLLEESQHDGNWTLALRVPLDLIYFPGHFPQAPVVPGVVQIDWALALAATRLGTPLRCKAMEALKFQHLLRPGDRADLTLHHDAARGKLHFAYRHGDKAFSSGRLAWSAR